MNVKIEHKSSQPTAKFEPNIEKALNILPTEHLRGLNKIVFVDQITEPRISLSQRETLPALYHPRMGGQMAWAEIAMSVVKPKKRFPQNLFVLLTMKSNLAQIIFSLAAQHYYFTLAKGIKKTQLETACRLYTEKSFEKWREQEGGWRVKLLKPFRPYLDKFAKRLATKYKAELEKQKPTK
jgi:hypothetical protein